MSTPEDASAARASAGKAATKAKKKKPRTPVEIKIRVSWCKGCGLCVDYCNQGVLEMDGVLPRVVDAEKCNECLLCEAMCPDFAIEVNEKGEIEAKESSEEAGS